MLSRLDDARVFLSSDDVVLGSRVGRRGPTAGQGSQDAVENGQRNLGADSDSGSDEDALESEEHVQLHPQHPYNMRRSRSMAAKALAVRGPGTRRSTRRRLAESTASQPMELVMLPSGDIRPRDECPPGMALPPSVPVPASRVGRRLEIGEISDDSPEGQRRLEEEEEVEDDSSDEEKPRVKRTHSERRVSGWEERRERPVTQRRAKERQAIADRRLEPSVRKTSASERHGGTRYASSDGEDASGSASASSLSSSGHADASTRNGPVARRQLPQRAARALEVDSDEEEDGHPTSHLHRRPAHDHRKERTRQALMISRQRTPKMSSRPRLEPERRGGSSAVPKAMEVAPVYHIADDDEDEDGDEGEVEEPAGQAKKPARRERTPRADRKLDVKQLVSSKEEEEENTPRPPSESMRIKQLERELQNEKKRVLEKMTLLLEEQGKNQQLHRQIEGMEGQLTASTASNTQRWEERVQSIERKHLEAMKAVEERLEQRDAVVLKLEQDKSRLKDAVAKLRERSGRENGKGPHTETESDVKSELERLAASIRKFLKRVDRWKVNSKEAMECCERKAELAALMDNMWLDFPQFPSWTDTSDNNNNNNNAAEATDVGQGENIVRFLKKRVRSREDELRQLQAKYVDLKEVCARQCVREADLQNFINEHRLRGTLVFRKGGHGDAGEEKRATPRQQREGKAPASSRVTRPESFYAEDQDEYEQDHGQRDNNDYESGEGDDEEEEDGEYSVQEPKIFVQVGRDGVYEHAPRGTSAVMEKLADQQRRQGRKKSSQIEVERIRLVPSPSLTQRFERVATPTSNGAGLNRKKKPQMLLQPPPRAGSVHNRPIASHPVTTSSSALARRRSKPAASSRPMPAASARATGAGRPWV